MKIFYLLLANLIMFLHLGVVLFNFGAFVLDLKFKKVRYIHLPVLLYSGYLMAAGKDCPLTTWENNLRWLANPIAASGKGFISRLLDQMLLGQTSPGVITAVTFTLIAAALWTYVLYPLLFSNGKGPGKTKS